MKGMPLYDYQCQYCQSFFEVHASFKEKEAGMQPECPQCHSQETPQVLTAGLLLHGNGKRPAGKMPAYGPNSGPGCCG
jgi:putative FmdB family regulatory protein